MTRHTRRRHRVAGTDGNTVEQPVHVMVGTPDSPMDASVKTPAETSVPVVPTVSLETSATATSTAPQSAVAEKPQPVRTERDKPVVVTGAAGFVGMHTCRALARAGWNVRAVVRNPTKAAGRLADIPCELKVGDIRDGAFMRETMSGAGAVVHLAAIAIERPGQSYESVNRDATGVVLDAARTAGVDRIIHMSQNGADSRSPFRFLRSKGMAQDMVTGSALRWTVFRPSVIFGHEDEFVNVLARLVQLTPVVFPLPSGGTSRFQPVCVTDVATAIQRALDADRTIGGMYALGGPAPLTLRQMAERILTAMQAHRVLVGVPIALLRPVIALAQRLLPTPPVTTSLLDLLAIDNTTPDNALVTTFGITPTPFAPEELLYLRAITARDALASLWGRR